MIATFNGLLVDGIPTDEQGLRELLKFDEELQNNDKDTSKKSESEEVYSKSIDTQQVTPPIRTSLRLQLKEDYKVIINIHSFNRTSTDSPRSEMTTPKIKTMIRCRNCEKVKRKCERSEFGGVCYYCIKKIDEINKSHRTRIDKKRRVKAIKDECLRVRIRNFKK
tara:strand:+ start:685 stop:1179 length:495 start_codon:yes stop_codon:yes gene_type:complete